MIQRRNILFLSSWYPSRIVPTDGNFVQRHAEAVALQHKVSVIFPIGDAKKESNTYEIVQENKKGVQSILVYFKKHPFFLINVYRKFKALKKALPLIGNIDIIHANVLYPIGVLAVWLSIKLSKPLLFTEHWTGYFHPEKSNLSSLKRFVIKQIALKPDFVVPVSNSLKKAMIQIGVKANYRVIGNAIDTNLFAPMPKKKSNRFQLLHISTLNNTHKNIVGMLEVIQAISKKRDDFTLHIIGDSNLEKTKVLIQKMEIPKAYITCHGTQTPAEIATFMQASDLYISFSNYETFGVVYIEALATETPVVCTDTGILTEHNELKDAFKLVPVKDKEMFKKYIENYLDSQYVINREAMRNFSVENFSFEAVSKQYTELYEKMLKE